MGYGDLSPHTQTGRILAIVYIPMAVGVVGSFLDAIANAILERKRKATEDYLESKQLTLQDLKMMDYNGDGKVTLAEFYEFTLIAMGQVDRDTMDHLKERFNKLDKDNSGALDKDDLVELAENNIATTTTSNNPYRYNPNAKTKKHEQLEQKLMARGSSALAYKQYPRNHP